SPSEPAPAGEGPDDDLFWWSVKPAPEAKQPEPDEEPFSWFEPQREPSPWFAADEADEADDRWSRAEEWSAGPETEERSAGAEAAPEPEPFAWFDARSDVEPEPAAPVPTDR